MKKLFRALFSAKMLLLLTFLLNVAMFVAFAILFDILIYNLFSIFIFFIVLIFIRKSNDPSYYKATWLLLIFILPVFGCTLYIYLKSNKGSRNKRRKWQEIAYESSQQVFANQVVFDDLKKEDKFALKESMYLYNTTTLPVYQNSTTTYLKDGEIYFNKLFEDLKSAEKFILIEYFIFKQGQIFDQLFEILKQKAREGVEIKLLYDDVGCLDKFKDKNIFKKLENYNIEALPFNKVGLHFNMFTNYRDHRKITVIDGKIAYTGGINFGDEYSNLVSPLGVWKDAGVRITGDAVWNMTVTFFNTWQFVRKQKIDILQYKVDQQKIKSKEYVQPFATGPVFYQPIARNIILNMVNNAKDYIYLTSPYFIVDQEFMSAIKLAAKSGVDVRFIVPAKPDKKLVYFLGRTYFKELISAGIKIYEYKPGFIHAKTLVVDNRSCLIGTINLDFRSLYLHFENSVLIHNSQTVLDVRKDIEDTINQSKLNTIKDMRKRSIIEKVLGEILRVFQFLM